MAPRKRHQDIDASAEKLPAEGFEAGGLFVFDARPVVKSWPGKVRVPTGGGQFKTHPVRYDLLYQDIEAMQQLDEDERAFLADGGEYGETGDPLFERLLGWSGFAKQGVGELAYSDAAKGELLASDLVRRSVKEALARMALGLEEKNSETPPAAGPVQKSKLNRAQRRAAGRQVAQALKGTG